MILGATVALIVELSGNREWINLIRIIKTSIFVAYVMQPNNGNDGSFISKTLIILLWILVILSQIFIIHIIFNQDEVLELLKENFNITIANKKRD